MVGMHMVPSSLTSMRLGMRRVFERVITRSLFFCFFVSRNPPCARVTISVRVRQSLLYEHLFYRSAWSQFYSSSGYVLAGYELWLIYI
jgi:hypothetical protein